MIKQTLNAVYENGVFRLLSPNDILIADGQQVRLVIEVAESSKEILDLAAQVYSDLTEDEINDIEKIALDRQNFFNYEKQI